MLKCLAVPNDSVDVSSIKRLIDFQSSSFFLQQQQHWTIYHLKAIQTTKMQWKMTSGQMPFMNRSKSDSLLTLPSGGEVGTASQENWTILQTSPRLRTTLDFKWCCCKGCKIWREKLLAVFLFSNNKKMTHELCSTYYERPKLLCNGTMCPFYEFLCLLTVWLQQWSLFHVFENYPYVTESRSQSQHRDVSISREELSRLWMWS